MNAKKRFACRSKKEALISFIQRKSRQRSILQAQLDDVNDALRQAQEIAT